MSTQSLKRSVETEVDLLEDIKAVIVNLEGTACPSTFVKDVVVPYVKDSLKSYFEGSWNEDECKSDVKALRDQAVKDKEEKVEGFVDIAEDEDKDALISSLVKNISWQIDASRSNDALSQLESHICREAYKSGKIQGKLFDDVAPAIREWVSEKRKVYLYSKDNVDNQKLMFGNSTGGNLGELFAGYFDTTTGAKQDKDSYTKIATELSLDPAEILLLTAVPSEAAPASEAGMKTSLVRRDGNEELSEEHVKNFNIIDTFSELTSATNGSAKRVDAGDAVDGAGDAKEVAETAPEGAADSTD